MYGTLPKDHKYHSNSPDSSLEEVESTPPPFRRDVPVATYKARSSFKRSNHNKSHNSTEEVRSASSQSHTNRKDDSSSNVDGTSLNTSGTALNTSTPVHTPVQQEPVDLDSSSSETPSTSTKTNLRPRMLSYGDTHTQSTAGKTKNTSNDSELNGELEVSKVPEVVTRRNRISRRETVQTIHIDKPDIKRHSADIAELLKLQSTHAKHDGLANVQNFRSKLLEAQQHRNNVVTDKKKDPHSTSGEKSSDKEEKPSNSSHHNLPHSASSTPTLHDSFSYDIADIPADQSAFTNEPLITPPLVLTPPIVNSLESGRGRMYTPSPSPELRQVAEDSEEEEMSKEDKTESSKKVKHTVAYKQAQHQLHKGESRVVHVATYCSVCATLQVSSQCHSILLQHPTHCPLRAS